MCTSAPLRTALLFMMILAATEPMRSQDPTPDPTWKFLPAGNRFRPLAANWQEPRLGVRKQAGSSKMRLDIGAGIEFLGLIPSRTDSVELRAAAEFFAYGLSTSVGGHRLQIDAIDGYFGGSLLLFVPRDGWAFAARLRILHLSSHFVDGHDGGVASPGSRGPIPFTRDFGELTAAPRFTAGMLDLRPYLGVAYSTLVRPDDLARWGGLAGIEIFHRGFPGSLFGSPSALYAAGHCTLEGNPDPELTASVEAGVHLGGTEGPAVRFFAGYFAGKDLFHQYYDISRHYWSLGFAIEVR